MVSSFHHLEAAPCSAPAVKSLTPAIYKFKCMSYFWILRSGTGQKNGLIKYRK